MATDIAIHVAPAWRDKANYVIIADLAKDGMVGQWEQLWAQQITDSYFVICCIPYFTYGLALGDTVRTTHAKGKSHVFSAVAQRSGRRVLRFWLKGGTLAGKDRLFQYLGDESPLHEWSSDNLVAIDVPQDEATQNQLIALVKELQVFGIEGEWGD